MQRPDQEGNITASPKLEASATGPPLAQERSCGSPLATTSGGQRRLRGPFQRKSAEFAIFLFLVMKGPYLSGYRVLKFRRANATRNPPKTGRNIIMSYPFTWLAQFETPAL